MKRTETFDGGIKNKALRFHALEKIMGAGNIGRESRHMKGWWMRWILKICGKRSLFSQCYPFRMCRGLRYSYTLKRKLDGSYGDELFFSRKEKSIIHSTVERTYRMVMKMDRKVSGPKTLGCLALLFIPGISAAWGDWKEAAGWNDGYIFRHMKNTLEKWQNLW